MRSFLRHSSGLLHRREGRLLLLLLLQAPALQKHVISAWTSSTFICFSTFTFYTMSLMFFLITPPRQPRFLLRKVRVSSTIGTVASAAGLHHLII